MDQAQEKRHAVLAYRGLAHFLLLIVLSGVSESLLFETGPEALTRIFLMIVVITLGQSLMTLRADLNREVLLAFFLSDAALAMVLVRNTGASASPFLVLFPLIALASAVVFRSVLSLVVLGGCVGFLVFSVGFGPSIVGNAVATGLTSILGFYLVKALDRSGAELKKSEGARRRLENLQKAILANIPSGLMSVDSTGRIIQINHVGLRILGLTEQTVLATPLRALLPELQDEVGRLSTQVPGFSNLDAALDRPEVRYRTADGNELRLGYSVTRLSDPEDRSTLGSLVVFQDLTQIAKMEENLRMSEKLAAVGKLAAGIAHEIRNPLAGISGSAQLLLAGDAVGEDDKRLLNIIQRESTRLDGLITEFLEYVRPQRPKLEPVDLVRVAEEVIESLGVNTKWKRDGCQIALIVAESRDVRVMGDRNKITQTLINLLLNSSQAGARRVELRISATGALDVRDDGRGISEANQARLFEPFFTTKESGTGLGLATTYRALEAMEARIMVVSPLPDFSPQGGTMFTIQFRL